MDLSQCSQPDSLSVEKIGELQSRLQDAVIHLGQHDASSEGYSNAKSDAHQCLNELGALDLTVGDLRATKIWKILNDDQFGKILPADLSAKVKSLIQTWNAKKLEYRDNVKQKLSKNHQSPHANERRRNSSMLLEPEVPDRSAASEYSKFSSLPSFQPPGMFGGHSSSIMPTSQGSTLIKGEASELSEKSVVISTAAVLKKSFPRDETPCHASSDIDQRRAPVSKSAVADAFLNSPQQRLGLESTIWLSSYKVAGGKPSSSLPPTRSTAPKDIASFKAPAPLPLGVRSVRPPEDVGVPPTHTSVTRFCDKTANVDRMENDSDSRSVDSVPNFALDRPVTQVSGSTFGRVLSQTVSARSAPVEIPSMSQTASMDADRVLLKALVTQNCNTFSKSLSALMSKILSVEEACKCIKEEIRTVQQQVRDFQLDFDKYCPSVVDGSAHPRSEPSQRCQLDFPAPSISAAPLFADLERSSGIGGEASAYKTSVLSARCDGNASAASRGDAGASSILRAECVSLRVADLPSPSVASAFISPAERPEQVLYPTVAASTADRTLQPAAGDFVSDSEDFEDDDDDMSCSQVIDDLHAKGRFTDKERWYVKSNIGKFRNDWNRTCKKKAGLKTSKKIQSNGRGRWKAAHRSSLGKAVALGMLPTKCWDPDKELGLLMQ